MEFLKNTLLLSLQSMDREMMLWEQKSVLVRVRGTKTKVGLSEPPILLCRVNIQNLAARSSPVGVESNPHLVCQVMPLALGYSCLVPPGLCPHASLKEGCYVKSVPHTEEGLSLIIPGAAWQLACSAKAEEPFALLSLPKITHPTKSRSDSYTNVLYNAVLCSGC